MLHHLLSSGTTTRSLLIGGVTQTSAASAAHSQVQGGRGVIIRIRIYTFINPQGEISYLVRNYGLVGELNSFGCFHLAAKHIYILFCLHSFIIRL